MGIGFSRAGLFCCSVGALQHELSSLPPPPWLGRAELRQGLPSCPSMGLKVHLWATWVGQEFSDLNGAVLRLVRSWLCFLFTFSC